MLLNKETILILRKSLMNKKTEKYHKTQRITLEYKCQHCCCCFCQNSGIKVENEFYLKQYKLQENQ